MNEKLPLVPEQREGRSIDVEESVALNSQEEATALFEIVAARLLDVNKWSEIAGTISADFKLVDSSRIEMEGAAKEGDLIRIDIPGPGPKAGDGYDWVEIEKIDVVDSGADRSVSMRVRPTIAHFYSPESTSTFTVTLQDKTVTAGIYDRNTKPNTSADNLQDKLRDSAVGAAAVTAFSKLQWKNLAVGLLKR